MRILRGIIAVSIIALGTLCLTPVAAIGQGPVLNMLNQIEPGRWVVRIQSASAGMQTETLCIKDGRKLIQLRHPAQLCERTIVNDSADSVTIQYTCQGKGYGLTSIRRESGRLVQIESQGIADGSPFEFRAEARKYGECAS